MSKTTYVSVCKNTILSNLKHKKNDPPIRISKGKYGKPVRKHSFQANGKVKIVYSPDKPMPWGARVYLEIEENA